MSLGDDVRLCDMGCVCQYRVNIVCCVSVSFSLDVCIMYAGCASVSFGGCLYRDICVDVYHVVCMFVSCFVSVSCNVGVCIM